MNMNQSLGILGGLGPLASAEFLKTIYELNVTDLEQEAPNCILYSDPTFPDRIDAIQEIADELLISLLVKSIESLCQLGVSKVVIVCVTIHYFLPKIPIQLRKKIISLIDVIIKEVLDKPQKYLLLCSTGTRQAGIFQNHPQWKMIEQYVSLPEEKDQIEIQNYIYGIKKNRYKSSMFSYFNTLKHKYQLNGFIAGCTEFHLLTKYYMEFEDKKQIYKIIDPLLIISQQIKIYLN